MVSLRSSLREELLAASAAQGFQRTRLIRSDRLPEAVRRHSEIAALGEGTYLLAALSCFRDEPDDLSRPGDPHALIAPFARRNYYRDAVRRLRQVFAALAQRHPETVLTRRRARIFSNSRFPEKALAAACGLGFIGRNSLVIAPGLGSEFIIAGFFLPLDLESDRPLDPLEGGMTAGGGCISCLACMEACPVAAIPEPGRVDSSRCLQALATTTEALPEEARRAWSFRLYGCQSCQEVCPWNQSLSLETGTELGVIGPSVALKDLLSRMAAGIKERFKASALDMSWIKGEALLRNALIAAGHRMDPVLVPQLNACLQSPQTLIREAAAWSLEQINTGKIRAHCD